MVVTGGLCDSKGEIAVPSSCLSRFTGFGDGDDDDAEWLLLLSRLSSILLSVDYCIVWRVSRYIVQVACTVGKII